MKIVFMGTPDFAAGALKAIIEAGHEVTLVVTQPDRAKGRSDKLIPSPVKEVALEHNIPVFQRTRVRALRLDRLRREVDGADRPLEEVGHRDAGDSRYVLDEPGADVILPELPVQVRQGLSKSVSDLLLCKPARIQYSLDVRPFHNQLID